MISSFPEKAEAEAVHADLHLLWELPFTSFSTFRFEVRVLRGPG